MFRIAHMQMRDDPTIDKPKQLEHLTHFCEQQNQFNRSSHKIYADYQVIVELLSKVKWEKKSNDDS